MSSGFVSNTFVSESNFDWCESLQFDIGPVTSSQNSQASSEYLHNLDLGFNPDDVMAEAFNCNDEIPISSVDSFDSFVDWEANTTTSFGQASPESSYTVLYSDNAVVYHHKLESDAAVEMDGTIVHILEPIDNYTTYIPTVIQNSVSDPNQDVVSDPNQDVVPFSVSSVDYSCGNPVDYAVPLSVLSETTVDDEDDFDGDEENLGSSVSATSDASPDSSAICPTSFLFSDDYLRTVSVKQLNLKIRELGVSREHERLVKKRRRTLKNRSYAHSSRQKRNGRHQEVDEKNAELQCQYDSVKRERDAYKRANVVLQRRVAHLERQLHTNRESSANPLKKE